MRKKKARTSRALIIASASYGGTVITFETQSWAYTSSAERPAGLDVVEEGVRSERVETRFSITGRKDTRQGQARDLGCGSCCEWVKQSDKPDEVAPKPTRGSEGSVLYGQLSGKATATLFASCTAASARPSANICARGDQGSKPHVDQIDIQDTDQVVRELCSKSELDVRVCEIKNVGPYIGMWAKSVTFLPDPGEEDGRTKDTRDHPQQHARSARVQSTASILVRIQTTRSAPAQ